MADNNQPNNNNTNAEEYRRRLDAYQRRVTDFRRINPDGPLPANLLVPPVRHYGRRRRPRPPPPLHPPSPGCYGHRWHTRSSGKERTMVVKC